MTSPADLGLSIGTLPQGPTDSVLDVPGVGLGHTTIVRDEPMPPEGRGIGRTGVTVLDLGGDLAARPVSAGGAILNGAGECTGFHSAQEWGLIETPIYLTSTMQLGRVYDAACRIALAEAPEVAEEVVIPVVGECDDSWLNFAGAMQIDFGDVQSARDAARDSIGSGVRPATGVDSKRAEWEQRHKQADAFANQSYPEGAQLCAKCNTIAVVMMDGCMTCLSCADSKSG